MNSSGYKKEENGVDKEISIVYPSESEDGDNGIDTELYQSMLNLLPTLKKAISKRIASEFEKEEKHVRNKYKLPINENLAIAEDLELKKIDLQCDLDELYIATGKAPIVVIMDDCFTNDLLLDVLKKVLGDRYDDFVSVIKISYSQFDDNEGSKKLDEQIMENIGNNSLIIMGGSYSDTYSVNPNMYKSKLAEMIKRIASTTNNKDINNRMLGVCFGQQFIANIIGVMNINKENIIATVKGSAQFGPSPCTVHNTENTKTIFVRALEGISSRQKDSKITTTFTRTGHVDFDLLNNKGKDQVIPLITDDISGDTVGWGSKNGNILGVQFHPEINIHKLDNVREEIGKVIHHLEKHYKKDIHSILDNFNLGEHVSKFKDLSEYFYVYALHAFTKDIIEKKTADYPEVTKKMVENIKSRLKINLSDESKLFDSKEREKIIGQIDNNGKLELNYNIDRKVDRGMKTYAEIAGIKDFSNLALDQKDFLKSLGYREPFFFCDLGAGNGTFIRELYEKIKGNDISVYGVGDKIYLDIFQGINKSKFGEEIPLEILQMFMRTLYMEYKKTRGEKSLIETVREILSSIELDPEQPFDIPFSCMEKDDVFATKQEKKLSEKGKVFLKENQGLIKEMIDDINNNIYSYFYGYFERIYVSDFLSFNIGDKDISYIDMQTSIRSTSHLDDDEYKQIIINYIDKFANPGSFFIDNGVHRSYTNVPRLKQLKEIKEEYKKRINIKLIYDTETNYFCSAIIETNPFHGDEFWKSHLGEGKILVDVEEAHKSTFFRMEAFIRNFIITNFKNYGVFRDHNKLIIKSVNKCVELKKEGKYCEIKKEIVRLVNTIVDNIHQIQYNKIDIKVIENYYDIEGKGINEISSEDFFMPEWVEEDCKRKN